MALFPQPQAVTLKAAAGVAAHDRAACLASGMDDFVSKPVQLASLEEALLGWLPARALESVPESLSA